MRLRISTTRTLAALAVGSALVASNAHSAAHETPKALDGEIEIVEQGEDAYVQSGGNAVRTGLGECLRLGGWSDENTIDACEGVEMVAEVVPEPEPVVEAPPAPKEPIITTATLGAEALFDTEQSTLSAASEQALADLLVQLERFQEISDIEVVGHTDSRGAEAYNQQLSEQRAQSVQTFLQAAYPDVEITARGEGEANPVATNTTPEGRQLNRRVEIQVTAKSVTDA